MIVLQFCQGSLDASEGFGLFCGRLASVALVIL
jgi:hypothetical protein